MRQRWELQGLHASMLVQGRWAHREPTPHSGQAGCRDRYLLHRLEGFVPSVDHPGFRRRTLGAVLSYQRSVAHRATRHSIASPAIQPATTTPTRDGPTASREPFIATLNAISSRHTLVTEANGAGTDLDVYLATHTPMPRPYQLAFA